MSCFTILTIDSSFLFTLTLTCNVIKSFIFRDVLGDYGYVKIKTNRLVGIVLSVYVRREALLRYEDIDAYVTRTGFGGLWVSFYFCFLVIFLWYIII